MPPGDESGKIAFPEGIFQLCSVKMILVLPLFFMCASLIAAPAGSPVKGIPKIDGREIARFVVLESPAVRAEPQLFWGDINQRVLCDLLAGQFVAVSQDSKRVYYQASNGLRRLTREGGVAEGGIYVSTTKRNDIFSTKAMRGTRRRRSESIPSLWSANKCRKLKIGHPGR